MTTQVALDASSIPKDAKIAALEKSGAEAEKVIADARVERMRQLEEVDSSKVREGIHATLYRVLHQVVHYLLLTLTLKQKFRRRIYSNYKATFNFMSTKVSVQPDEAPCFQLFLSVFASALSVFPDFRHARNFSSA